MLGDRSTTATAVSQAFEPDQLRVDVHVRRAYVGQREITLTKQAFDLLGYLLAHQGRVVPNDELVRAIWEHEILEDHHFLQTAMYRLRQALRRAGVDDPIEVVRGVGYSIRRGEAAQPVDQLREPQVMEAAIRAGFIPQMLLDRRGRIVVANEAAAERLGYRVDELEQLSSVAMLSPPAVRATRMAMFGKVLAGEEILFPGSEMQHHDGSIVPLDASVRPVVVAGEVVGAVFELWSPYDEPPSRSNGTVAASPRLLAAEAAIRASRLPTIVIDANQRILLANEAMAKLTGYTTDELESLPSAEPLSPPEARAQRAQNLVAILSGQSHGGWSEPIVRRDGSVVTVELIAEPLALGGEVAGVMVQAWPPPGEYQPIEADTEARAN